MRVLIADDTSSLRLLVRRILDGHEVVEAGSGGEALDVLRASPVEVAILDVNMPDGNGLDVCRAIRRDPSHPATVVIVITANGAMEAEQQALDAGADAFLAKPFSPRRLAVLIDATTSGTSSRLTI
jgi:CheY-like chemotaxis protein